MLIKDFVYAARMLRKSPLFTLAAILTIGLGVGASTAIFSVTNAVMLRPLPYRDPGRLVYAIGDLRKRDVKDFPLSNAGFLDLRNGTREVFDEVGAVSTGRGAVPREDGTSEQVRLANVSTNFLQMLGAKPLAGRMFEDKDGVAVAAPNKAPAGQQNQARPPAMAILSYEYWQRRFGGRADIIGQAMPGQGQGATEIVGVLAPGFELLFPVEANMEHLPDVFFAARIPYDNENRNQVQHRAIARLRDGVSIEQAQNVADRIAAEARKNFLISGTAGYAIRLEPVHKHLIAEVRPALLALTGAVIFLLLIACVNVANLLLVRASLREREYAVRTALGGNRWSLIRQSLAEASLLAGGGAALGLLLAWAGINELRVMAPAELPRLDTIRIDPMVVLFALGSSLIAAAIFGMVPALRASKPEIALLLRGSGRTSGLGATGFLRSAAVIAEVALSFVLLIGSGLMLRSFVELQRIAPGFDPGHMLTFQVLGGQRRPQSPAQAEALIRNQWSQLKTIPGIENITASTPFPLTGGFSPIRWGLEAALADPTKFQAVDFQIVLPGYFETMKTRILEGRSFTDADNSPQRTLVVIDTALAAKAYPGQSAVGKRLLVRIRGPQPEWVEVIGVAEHQRTTSLAVAGREQIYFTDGFVGHGAVARWAMRTSGDPANYSAAARAAVLSTDPKAVILEMKPMEAVVKAAQAGTRFQMLLIGVFAAIAALLASVGLYGVLSTVVRQRTPEIGVRMALGAAPSKIFALVVSQGLTLSAMGIGAGLIAASILTQAMRTMLVGVRPTDPLTFAGMALFFFLIACVASWLPARRAASLDPTIALRDE